MYAILPIFIFIKRLCNARPKQIYLCCFCFIFILYSGFLVFFLWCILRDRCTCTQSDPCSPGIWKGSKPLQQTSTRLGMYLCVFWKSPQFQWWLQLFFKFMLTIFQHERDFVTELRNKWFNIWSNNFMVIVRISDPKS